MNRKEGYQRKCHIITKFYNIDTKLYIDPPLNDGYVFLLDA